jgi:hypothetical protein
MRTSSAVRQFAMRVPLAAVLIVLLPALSAAQEPVKSFDQLDTRLKPGDTVWITDAQGREIKGKIRELTPSALMLDGGNGRSFQAGDVALVAQHQGHKTGKGALWGLVAGGAASVFPAVSAGTCHEEDCQMVAILIPGRKQVVYRAPGASGNARLSLAPVVTPRTKGVAVSFAF